jgi:hypothetical protein
MEKKSYHEGWGFSDTIKLLIKGTQANRDAFYKELKVTFPTDDIEKVGATSIEAFVYERQIPVVKKMATVFKMKIAYMGGGKTDDLEIAKTILQQLGGQGRLVVMTGAYNFVALRNGVAFKLKSRKANYVKITLNGKDLYDVEFQKIFGTKSKIVAEHNDVYFDQLIPIVEKETEMYLKLFKKGGFVSTQNRDMVLSQLKSIHHHEEELRSALKTSPEIEAWVLAKVQRATTDLSDITHYLDGKTEYKKGGGISSFDYGDNVIIVFNKKVNLVVKSKLREETIIFEKNEDIEVEIDDFKGETIDVIFVNDQREKATINKKDIYSLKLVVTENSKYKKPEFVTDQRLTYKPYKTGGTTPIIMDLFEDYENIPLKVQKILDKYEESFEDGDYQGLTKAHNELAKIGYTFEFYLDGQAYGLRPTTVELNQLQGYEEFAEGGVAQGLSVADANPYIAGAKAVQGIAPQSVSAIDQKIARKINPDPNRPVFFKVGGRVGDYVQFKGMDDEIRTGVITEDLGGDNYAVSSGFGQVLVNSENYIGKGIKPSERKKFLGIFEDGGVVSTQGFKVGDVLIAEYNWSQIPKPKYEVLEILGLKAPQFSGKYRNQLRLKDLQTGEEFIGNEGRYDKI